MAKTDRKLLEAAAQAAGYKSHGYGELCGGAPCLFLQEADFTGMWAPLTDDGDALRLAVKLDLLHIYHMDSPVWLLHFDATDPDKEGATRRAFVCAAAALAKSAAVGAA